MPVFVLPCCIFRNIRCGDLQDFARSHVETCLHGGATGCAAVGAALTGHQLPAAAAIAAAMGDVRLSSVLVQVVCSFFVSCC